MARGRRATRPRPPLRVLLLALLAVAGVAAAGWVILANDGPDSGSPREMALRDVHGIAASPTEPGVLLVATHEGIVRHALDQGWSRVGDARDDFMGFTMHPTDGNVFWTSGHPAGGGNMGVRRTDDGGLTWRTVWSQPVDFHAMTVAPGDPQRLYGWWQRQVLRSDDGGASWAAAGPAPVVRALAGSPESPDVLLAATGTGILRSEDAGATWRAIAEIPALTVAVDPLDARRMYAGGDGALWRSVDGGATWESLAVAEAGAFGHLSASRAEPGVVYAATYATGIHRSEDGGETWSILRRSR